MASKPKTSSTHKHGAMSGMFNTSDYINSPINLCYMLGIGTPKPGIEDVKPLQRETQIPLPGPEKFRPPPTPDSYETPPRTTHYPAASESGKQGGLRREVLYTQAQVFSDVKNGIQKRIETESDTEQLEANIVTLQQQIALVKKYELRILDLLENPSIASDIKNKIFLAKSRAKTLFTRLNASGSIDLRGPVYDEQQKSCEERGRFQALLEGVLPDAEGFVTSVDLYNQLRAEEEVLQGNSLHFSPMLSIIHLASEIETLQVDRSVISIAFYPTLKGVALTLLKRIVPAIQTLCHQTREELTSLRHDPSKTTELLGKCRDAEHSLSLYQDAQERVPYRWELNSDLLLLKKEMGYLQSSIADIYQEKMAEKNTAYLLAIGRGILFGAGLTFAVAVPTIGSSILISAVQSLFTSKKV